MGPAGSEGSQGAQGSQGPQGPQGPAGPAGEDAVNTCSDCHDASATIVAIERQYAASVHGTGMNFERDGSPCNQCHTHQGFMAAVAGAPISDVENPAPINCRTCHEIHTTYTAADYGLTVTAPVDLMMGGTVDLGAGNLCATCHQNRVPEPTPTLGGGGTLTIPSPYYGVHYGNQGNVGGGTGAFEFAGSKEITGGPGVHAEAGCPTCHMAEPYGAQSGGHTWAMSYEYHGSNVDNIAGCNECHNLVEDFGFFGIQERVEELLGEVKTLLVDQGVINASSGRYVPGTYPEDLVAAAVNWQMFYKDGSKGIHNPRYAISVLMNTLEYLQSL